MFTSHVVSMRTSLQTSFRLTVHTFLFLQTQLEITGVELKELVKLRENKMEEIQRTLRDMKVINFASLCNFYILSMTRLCGIELWNNYVDVCFMFHSIVLSFFCDIFQCHGVDMAELLISCNDQQNTLLLAMKSTLSFLNLRFDSQPSVHQWSRGGLSSVVIQ